MTSLPIGIQANGIRHRASDPPPDILDQFKMVRDCGLFDYVEKTPGPDEVDSYLRAADHTGIPLRCGGWYYTLGRDEGLLRDHLDLAGRCGMALHNIQVLATDAAGRPVDDARLVEAYVQAMDRAADIGVEIAFEVHVNMWSEDFRRVAPVARAVEARGRPFRLTLDHSHVIFKIDHPEEQEVGGIREDVEAGKLVLDPDLPGAVTTQWIEANWVAHAHARPVIPNNPRNWAFLDADGRPGRGIQYPFAAPPDGAFDGPWQGDRLTPWKRVIRQLLDWHAQRPDSPLGQITTEYIPGPDYGAGTRYSLFEQSQACAAWLREEWRLRAADGTDG
ncbi:MAG: hypothetical protein RLO50_21325 [Azospirillaceae bacterium]